MKKTHYAILGILAYEPATGYEIRVFLEETVTHFWKESFGQIYPALEELKADGLADCEEVREGGRKKKRYSITQTGEALFRAWLRSPDYQIKPGRNELLLKLFLARGSDASWLIPQVNSYLFSLESVSTRYGDFRKSLTSPDFPADRARLMGITLDYGEELARIQKEWCRKTLTILDAFEDSVK